MNSYFEQSGFYGHPHQAAAGMMSSSGHDQTTAAAAAYRGFPLSLGMSPYANHHLHQTRTAQDSPYDASITAACKQIYDGAYNKDCSKTVSGNGTANGTSNSGSASAGNNNTTDTNGYKDVWNSTGNNGSQNSAPVRPSACTPDSRVGGYIDASGGSPVSRTGSSATGGAWNSNCTIGTTGSQSSASASLHQNHTFYPWMAIAGLLIRFCLNCENILILGDFNHELKLSSPLESFMLQSFDTRLFSPRESTTNARTVIDEVFDRIEDYNIEVFIYESYSSHHKPLVIRIHEL
ncbi:hypothetical protein PVAND_004043 [Polypedilum vanderplanki]|uniref:Uncharacterized protein n=1 Tax=Polypedilum vanderplanki TaxID=319348 RepID=A0A9J6BXW2_POLVA|nr:hypothetical protein PVAND_004043 [Polypedilum vanderplanki]